MGKIKDSKEPDVKFDPQVEIGEQVKKLIEKKKRNLEKRKNKLEETKKKATHEKLLPEQEEALKNLTSVQDTLTVIQSLLDQVQILYTQQKTWLKKEQKASLKKQNSQKASKTDEKPQPEPVAEKENVSPPLPVEDMPSEPVKVPAVNQLDDKAIFERTVDCFTKHACIYRLLQCFGEEDVRQLFLDSSPECSASGVIPLQQTDLDWLDEASDLLNPLSYVEATSPDAVVDAFGCNTLLTTKEVQDILSPAYRLWTDLLSQEEKPMLSDGTTFKQVYELCARLIDCEFFKNWKAKPIVQSVPQTPNAVVPEEVPKEPIRAPVQPPAPVQHHVASTSAVTGVDRMLQTLGNAYQFIQIGTPEKESHQSNAAARQEQIPETNYWTSKEVPAAPQPHTFSQAPPAVQHAHMSWDAESVPEETQPEEVHHPSKVSQLQENDDSTQNAPVGSHSWADRVRQNKEASGHMKPQYDNYQPQQPSNGDVFATASQSQFISNHQGGDYSHRRGGGGSGRGLGRGGSGFHGNGRGRENGYRSGGGGGYGAPRGRPSAPRF